MTRQHMPASVPWTLGILGVILIAFLGIVFWYMK
jgi:hypothetical protein